MKIRKAISYKCKEKKSKTRNVLHKKNWNQGAVHVHVESPLITLIKRKNNEKSDEDCLKIKLRRDPTSKKSDLYEFKMTLFDNGDPEEFLLFIRNFSNDSQGIMNA